MKLAIILNILGNFIKSINSYNLKIKVNVIKMGKKMAMVNNILKIRDFMKGNGKMIRWKDRVLYIIKVVRLRIRDSGRMGNFMAKEKSLMKIFMEI
jgi:hypothetical protein